jgi:serine phosphatase RsbU (regulator of sigma subunit)
VQVFSRQTFAILTVIFCLSIVWAVWEISRYAEETVVSQALSNSVVSAKILREAQAVYNSEAVSRIQETAGIKITDNYLQHQGAIPIPATYLLELTDRIYKQNLSASVRLYSDYPFPRRKQSGGVKDAFEKEALQALRSRPQQPYWKLDRDTLRYTEAIIMKPNCVKCHNTSLDSPKKDWKVGDVRGALEISQALGGFKAQSQKALAGTLSMLGGISVLGVSGLVLTMRQLQGYSRTLEHQVRARTADLAAANEQITKLNEKLQADNLRMGAELEVARQLQGMVLPKTAEIKAIADLDIESYMKSADEVGGDYYDILYTDGVVTLGIGDVTGHGLESGILMLMTQTAVRTLNEVRQIDPVRFLDILNRTLYKNIQRMGTDKNLSLAILNYVDGLVSISGQHEEIIIVRSNGTIERIDTIDLGLPIGLDSEIADFIDRVLVKLAPGDGLVLYTDGIPEAENLAGEYYGLERLCHLVSQNWHSSSSVICQNVVQDLNKFIGKQIVFDDITLLVMKLKNESVSSKLSDSIVQISS